MALHRPSTHRDPDSRTLGPRALAQIRRGDDFHHIVASTLEYLKGQWPLELEKLRIEVVGMPATPVVTRVPRWSIHPESRTIRIYRHPVERMTKLHKRDQWHRRVLVESVVFSAVAEMLGTDPWQLAPERYHPH